MRIIMLALTALVIYFFYGFFVEVGFLLFMALFLVVWLIRAPLVYKKEKAERDKALAAEKSRNEVFGRIHLRAAMVKTMKEDHPEDWVERMVQWDLEQIAEKEKAEAAKQH